MRLFEQGLYYSCETVHRNEMHEITRLTFLGVELIIHYLKNKYHTNIHQIDMSYCSLEAPPINPILKTYIDQAREEPSLNYRQAYLCRDELHTVLVVYIRERDKEIILSADSVSDQSKYAAFLYELTGIKVCKVKPARQLDRYSCHVDALVMARDITRVYAKDYYMFSSLLSYFEKGALRKEVREETWIDGQPSFVELPNVLLKTAQSPQFFQTHKNDEIAHVPVYKQETIDAFRARYETPNGYHGYLECKALKYRSIIEIQFYIHQIESELGRALSTQARIEFIVQAKRWHKEKRPLNLLAERCLECQQPLAEESSSAVCSIS